jgi:hypothetical protein
VNAADQGLSGSAAIEKGCDDSFSLEQSLSVHGPADCASMKPRSTGPCKRPWPAPDEDGSSAPAAFRLSDIHKPAYSAAIDTDDAAALLTNAGATGTMEAERARQLMAARDGLSQILPVLDEYSRSAAPGTVDLAIHQINRELGV